MATLISTPGSTQANSYTSLAFANEYNERTGNATQWDSLSDALKEQNLMWATTLLESAYEFKGARRTDDQRLKWPRVEVRLDGVLLDSDSVPERVQEATAELAKTLLTKDFTAEISSDGIKRAELDTLKVEFMANSEQSIKLIPDYVSISLQPLVAFAYGASTIRISR
jgi:hypothetical protein